jgi:hypothetical protein
MNRDRQREKRQSARTRVCERERETRVRIKVCLRMCVCVRVDRSTLHTVAYGVPGFNTSSDKQEVACGLLVLVTSWQAPGLSVQGSQLLKHSISALWPRGRPCGAECFRVRVATLLIPKP